jgi:hypothetical protein
MPDWKHNCQGVGCKVPDCEYSGKLERLERAGIVPVRPTPSPSLVELATRLEKLEERVGKEYILGQIKGVERASSLALEVSRLCHSPGMVVSEIREALALELDRLRAKL